jgi:hypothetical protein
MLKQLESWWQNATPETQAYVWDGSLALIVLLGGHILGSMVARGLRVRNFDEAFRPSRSSSQNSDTGRRFTAVSAIGILVRLTVWGAGAWWFARRYGRPDLADTLALIGGRTWAAVGFLGGAILLAGLLARRIAECLRGSEQASPNARLQAAPQRDLSGVVAAGVYGLVLLLALLTAADYFAWPLTRTAAVALWQLTLNLLIAGAAVLIGGLGARWARDIAAPGASASPQQRAGYSTALGIVAGTTILGAGVLLFSAGVSVGLAAMVILGVPLWLGRAHLSDVVAGLRLRTEKVGTVWLDGAACQVGEIGWLQTDVGRAGEYVRVPNRQVLEAATHAAPAAAGRH